MATEIFAFVTEEEAYEFRSSTKAVRRSGVRWIRPKVSNRESRKREEAGRRRDQRRANNMGEKSRTDGALSTRRKEVRAKDRREQLERRKENIQKRLEIDLEENWKRRLDSDTRPIGVEWKKGTGRTLHTEAGEPMRIMPAADLGVEEGSMYDRLLSIIEGEEIQPEDFDLLLRLDANNAKNTMEVSRVSEIEIVIVGSSGDDGRDGEGGNKKNIAAERLRYGCCLICLESFVNLEDGAELRRLPCDHMYCKDCIDQWLTENSVRCPELSCFWSTEY